MVQSPRKRYEYERAVFLRKKGKSYNVIRKELGLSKSTISLWCRDVELSPAQKRSLTNNSRRVLAQRLGALANKEKRQKEVLVIKDVAKKEINILSTDMLRIVGAVLYWAEGSKKVNTSITNSDPRVIRLIIIWLKKVLNIEPNQLNVHLHIHYKDDENKIKSFWSKLTGIPLKNFGKSFIKPKGTGHRTNILPNGIIRIRVKGPKTGDLRHRIIAWTEKIYELAIQ